MIAGCGGDDDPGPTDPGGGGGGTDPFDEATAVQQADVAADAAVQLVEDIGVFAGGISKSADDNYDYGWSEENQRWEWHWMSNEDDSTFDWLYWVQYLDSDGEPLQNSVGAASISHSMYGTSSAHYENEDTVVDWDYEYDYLVSATGLDGDVHTLNGNGGYDLDYSGRSAGHTFDYSYVIEWAILAPGITRVADGGCPIGTIRYDFAPYYCLIVFDGTDTATSTLYDGNGNVVPDGGRTLGMICGDNPGK